jgi:colanic acid/amylovoran biosynthesis protein
MKILITNIVTLNTGDAAILLAEIELIKKVFGNETKIVIYDSNPDASRKYYSDLEFRKLVFSRVTDSKLRSKVYKRIMREFNCLRFLGGAWLWRNSFRVLAGILLSKDDLHDVEEYGSADLIVSTGGTILVENYYLEHRIFDYKLSLMMEKPLVFFTQSLGPFNNRRNRKYFKKIFDEALVVFLRDKKSLKNLNDIEVKNQNLFIASDAAFALADMKKLKSRSKEGFVLSSNPQVAISVREWKYFKSVSNETGMKTYFECIRVLVDHLVRQYNAEVTFISTCQGISEYWTDDSKIAEKIVHNIPDELRKQVRIDSTFHSPLDLIPILKGYDLVVATRLHMAILALGVGVPVLPIAYEFKTEELFKRLGLGRWVQNIEKLNEETIKGSIDTFLESLPELFGALLERIIKERESTVESAFILKKHYDDYSLSHANIA